jgi:hypothetical protein
MGIFFYSLLKEVVCCKKYSNIINYRLSVVGRLLPDLIPSKY